VPSVPGRALAPYADSLATRLARAAPCRASHTARYRTHALRPIPVANTAHCQSRLRCPAVRPDTAQPVRMARMARLARSRLGMDPHSLPLAPVSCRASSAFWQASVLALLSTLRHLTLALPLSFGATIAHVLALPCTPTPTGPTPGGVARAQETLSEPGVPRACTFMGFDTPTGLDGARCSIWSGPAFQPVGGCGWEPSRRRR
jgi:hypothetical protein